MPEVMPLLLIVEDDMQMRKFLRASLSSHGYRLVEATNGSEGLSQAACSPYGTRALTNSSSRPSSS